MTSSFESPATPAVGTPAPLSVSELNRRVRAQLEQGFPLLWVSGELSNVSQAASGHVYFTLKDAGAQVRCAMWRNRAQLLGWRPENGQRVEARALVTLFEARGEFQLNVEGLRRAGQGDLFRQFLQLKAKLEAEGLFESARKRPLPSFPRNIALVTSPQAAALRDVLTTLRRRAPHVRLTLYPTPVQGEGAGTRIAAALATACQGDHDLVMLCRGGGSIEDLWAFNEEVVARAIVASPLPVICGVGHETDFTIADFAADFRAPTPTAAAEMAAPDAVALSHRLDVLSDSLKAQFRRHIDDSAQQVDWLAARLKHPSERLARQRGELAALHSRLARAQAGTLANAHQRWQLQRHALLSQRPHTKPQNDRLDTLALRLQHAARRRLDAAGHRLDTLSTSLRQLDPAQVLARGYALVRDETGGIVRDAAQLSAGAALQLAFGRGEARATVDEIIPALPEQHSLL